MATTDLGKWMITNGGDYNPDVTYEKLTMVMYDNSTYITLKTVTGVTPSNDQINYALMARGFDPGVLSSVTAVDTSGALGNAGETVSAQSLVDYLADAVMTKLVEKANISNVQVNDSSKVPSAALAYAMQQQITENEEAITGLNNELDDMFNPGGAASGDSGKFTQYLTDFLSPDKYGLQFDVRILDNHEENNIYAPPHGDYENGINWGYYIVFTFGERRQNSIYHRIHQIAFNPFNLNTGRFYMRVQHDENVTDWFSYGDNKRFIQNPDGTTAIQSISPVSGTLYRLQISETGTVKVYKSVDNGQSWASKDVFSYENS